MEYLDLNLGKFLIKESSKFIIPRKKILKILKENTQNNKVILISAPPGYGKTIFLSSVINEFKDFKFFYYNLNEEDKDFYKFILYLIFGIRKIIKNFGGYLLEFIKTSPPYEKIIKNFTNEVIRKAKGNIIIIFDDFHHIQDEKFAHYFLNYFLNNTPFSIKLILSSRKVFDENIEIFRKLNIKGEVLHLSKDLLSFTEEEIKNFAEFFGIKLKESEVKKIKELSEGWALYLHWLFKEMEGKHLSFPYIINKIKTYPEGIFNYINKEIFSKFNSKDKRFLSFYALVEEKEIPILARILNIKNFKKILEKLYLKAPCILEKRNDFYILHPLFKEFLKRKLKKVYSKEIFNKLAKYYESRNIRKGILFYLRAKNFEKLTEIFLKNLEYFLKNREYHFIHYICENIPFKYYKKYPLLFYHRIYLKIIWEKKVNEGEKLLKILEKLKFKEKEVKVKLLKALLYDHKNEIDKAIEMYKKIIKITEDKELIKSCLVNLGISEGRKGNLEEAKIYFLDALKITQRKNILEDININTNLFIIEIEYGNYEIYEKMLELWEKYYLLCPYSLLVFTINLISLEIVLNKIEEAEKHLEWFFEKVFDTSNDFYIGLAYEFFGDIASLKGNFEEAEEFLNKALKMAEEKNIMELKYRIGLSFIENYIRKRDIEKLRKWIYLIEKEFGGLKEINFYKGKLKFLEGKYEDAKKCFESYLKIPLKNKFFNTIVLYNLMLTEYKLKNYQKAKEIYKNIDFLIKEKYDFLVKNLTTQEKEIIGSLGVIERRRQKIEVKEKKFYILDVCFFGNFELYHNSHKLEIYFRTRKYLSLFAFLLFKSQFFHPDILIEMYWKEMELNKAKNNLYVAVNRINKEFRKILNRKVIIKTNEGYGINPEIRIKKDIDDFEGNIKMAKNYKFKNDIEKTIEYLEKAKKIYRGDFLQNLYDFWVEEKREYYKNIYLNILKDLGEIYKEIGELNESSLNFEEYLKTNPYDDKVYNELIKIYEELKVPEKIKKIQNLISNW
ncbi:MAG: BTAD domain-containing putative transcriptional regulator [candidate division WOR-3 bacterium]